MNTDGETVSYLRVSTQAQVENGDGLGTQRKRILDFAKERNLIISKFYCDEGISGTIKDRPALLSLLSDCESGKIRTIIVYKMDRLARELTISLFLEKEFMKCGVEVLSVVDPELDNDDPLEKAFRRIAYVFAELEKDVITARLKDGRLNKAKKGGHAVGPFALGYTKVDGKLEIVPEEAKWVEKIFRWRAKGYSYTKIINSLNKFGVATKRGKSFSIDSIKYLLGNSLYHGANSFGDVHVKGTHQKIVSKRLFLKVQDSCVHKIS